MVTDSDGVVLATLQVGDGAAGVGGAAAQEPLHLVLNDGRVGVHLWLAAP